MRGFVAILFSVGVQAALFAAEPPAKLLDLSRWKLTLPVDADQSGRADEIGQPELGRFVDVRYFFADTKAQGVVFRAHCGGSTTKGSNYPRCELREMDGRGKKRAAWGTDDGMAHTMTIKAAITKTPPVKRHVVCAQIHDADDDVLMVRLEGTKLFVERNSTGDVMLDRGYRLGNPFEITIQAAEGRIRVWHDRALKLNWELSRKGCYFKAGCYTQSNPSKGDDAESDGEVVIHRLKVEHQRR